MENYLGMAVSDSWAKLCDMAAFMELAGILARICLSPTGQVGRRWGWKLGTQESRHLL